LNKKKAPASRRMMPVMRRITNKVVSLNFAS
jgi:hypothetical protein